MNNDERKRKYEELLVLKQEMTAKKKRTNPFSFWKVKKKQKNW